MLADEITTVDVDGHPIFINILELEGVPTPPEVGDPVESTVSIPAVKPNIGASKFTTGADGRPSHENNALVGKTTPKVTIPVEKTAKPLLPIIGEIGVNLLCLVLHWQLQEQA